MVKSKPHVDSVQQTEIYNFFSVGRNHLVVRARAGTGKTTTILKGIDYAPEEKILLCAFNKRIADELNGRITNRRATAKTLHAIGYGIVRKYWEYIKVQDRDQTPNRAELLSESVCGSAAPDVIKRLVSKLHTLGREICPHARRQGDLEDLMFRFDCDPDEMWSRQGFDAYYVEQKALAAMELAATIKPKFIDYADMIFLPVRNHWIMPQYDMVVVDEAQDMTVTQLEIARGVCKKNGRIIVVGDDRQAIYGFRGADSNSLDRLKVELRADELGLTTTYRCGHAIVREAQRLVPDIEAYHENSEGVIDEIGIEDLGKEAAHGDFILSRVNAPLVAIAMDLLRQNKRARIAGKDIGTGLTALVRKMKASSVELLVERVEAWREREVTKWTLAQKESRIDAVNDKAEMIFNLAEDAATVDDVTRKITALFTDDGLGLNGVITCSSVHKAKGLEANRVFVLWDTLRRTSPEEDNIAYVAITRAMNTLVKVTAGGKPKIKPDICDECGYPVMELRPGCLTHEAKFQEMLKVTT